MGFQYRVSLQIKHPTYDPAAICAGIGLDADWSWKVGEARSTPKGRPLPGIYPESYCCFQMGQGEDRELANCLKESVAKLEPIAPFLSELRNSGGKLTFYVGWVIGDRGEIFDMDLLSSIARLGIDLGIEPFKARQSASRSRTTIEDQVSQDEPAAG